MARDLAQVTKLEMLVSVSTGCLSSRFDSEAESAKWRHWGARARSSSYLAKSIYYQQSVAFCAVFRQCMMVKEDQRLEVGLQQKPASCSFARVIIRVRHPMRSSSESAQP